MKTLTKSRILTWLTLCSLLLTQSGNLAGTLVQGQNVREPNRQNSLERDTGGARRTALDRFASDLTRLARQGALTPVTGFDAETNRAVQILARGAQNNTALIDDYGAGKHIIAEALAQRIAVGNVPAQLRDRRVLRLDTSALLESHKRSN
jgi:ATP-dependent Clp protease ATP-binding subunit ClpA